MLFKDIWVENMINRYLLLTVFDPRQGPTLHQSIPKGIDQRVVNTLKDVFEMSGPGYFYYASVHEPSFNSFNHYFEVYAPEMKGETMTMMLTLVMFDKKEPKNFRTLMRDCVLRIKEEPNIHKAVFDPLDHRLTEILEAVARRLGIQRHVVA